jgi:hypothetical protein
MELTVLLEYIFARMTGASFGYYIGLMMWDGWYPLLTEQMRMLIEKGM